MDMPWMTTLSRPPLPCGASPPLWGESVQMASLPIEGEVRRGSKVFNHN